MDRDGHDHLCVCNECLGVTRVECVEYKIVLRAERVVEPNESYYTRYFVETVDAAGKIKAEVSTSDAMYALQFFLNRLP
jgi:hypothetical protein